MRAEMITFFMRNGFISETTVLQRQGPNQLGYFLQLPIQPALQAKQNADDDDDHAPRIGADNHI